MVNTVQSLNFLFLSAQRASLASVLYKMYLCASRCLSVHLGAGEGTLFTVLWDFVFSEMSHFLGSLSKQVILGI